MLPGIPPMATRPMCVCTNVYIHIYICAYVCSNTHAHTQERVYNIYIHTHIYICVFVDMYVYSLLDAAQDGLAEVAKFMLHSGILKLPAFWPDPFL